MLLIAMWFLGSRQAQSDAPIPTMATLPLGPLRLMDAVPSFSLVTSTGKTFSSREQLGERGILIISLPEETKIGSRGDIKKIEPFVRVLAQSGDDLRAVTIAPVLLIRASNPESLAKSLASDSSLEVVNEKDAQTVRSLFGSASSQGSLIFIDKAGFWRRSDVFDSVESLTVTLKQISQAATKIEMGRAAPDFAMPTSGKDVFRLIDLRGRKNLLLTFFPKCFTGGCTNHLSSLRDHQAEFDASQTQILAVSIDPAQGPHGQLAFAARWNFGFPLVPDVDRNLCLLYGAVNSPNQSATRMSVLIDKEGIVRWTTRNVNIHTHGADVLATIKELGLDRAAPK